MEKSIDLRKQFECYRLETFERKKKDTNGFTKERKRIIKYKPSKKGFQLLTKRRGKTFLYEIYYEMIIEGELLNLRLTFGELVCSSWKEYLNQIIRIIKNSNFFR